MEFEDDIRAMTAPRGGAYPRPWMTDADPEQAKVLIVGASSAKTFRSADIGDHDQFLDALWNRNGRMCRAMYDAATMKPSRTRPNIDRLSEMLAARGLTSIQTNVSCASARYDAELSEEDRAHGTEIFKAVVAYVPWRAMIVYGVGASKRFGRAFGITMPQVPSPDSEPVLVNFRGRAVFVSPTLAPPSYRTAVWPYLERVVGAIAIASGATTTDTFSVLSQPSATTRPGLMKSLGSDDVPSHTLATPTDFKNSAANRLVWQRIHEIASASSLVVDPSRQQATLTKGPEHMGTTRVFRHKFKAAKPDLLVREDVFSFDAELCKVATWNRHRTRAFQALRTDDLQLLGRVLDAIEAFAARHAA